MQITSTPIPDDELLVMLKEDALPMLRHGDPRLRGAVIAEIDRLTRKAAIQTQIDHLQRCIEQLEGRQQ